MTKDISENEELVKCVLELDIDETAKLSVLDFIHKGQLSKAILLLQQYRREILNHIHNNQDNLYQIDFVLQKVKEQRK